MANTDDNLRRRKFKIRLAEIGETQMTVAKWAGISNGQFSKIMNGHIDPSDEVADRIADAFGRSRRALAL